MRFILVKKVSYCIDVWISTHFKDTVQPIYLCFSFNKLRNFVTYRALPAQSSSLKK